MAANKKIPVTKRKGAQTGMAQITTADFRQVIKVENPRNIYNLYTTEFSGLTPTKVHWYLDNARKGLNFHKSLLFEEIRRRDLRIGGICQTRKMGVAKKEWVVDFKKDSAVPESLQKDVLLFLDDNFEHVEIANFITDCVEAQLQGVSTFESNYVVDGKYVMADKIKYIPNHLLCFDDINDQYKYLDHTKVDAMKMREIGANVMQDRIDVTGLCIEGIHPDKIIEVHSLDGNAQNGFMNGCIDSLIWAFLFKNYGLKDWSIYVERFAQPVLVAKYPQLMGGEDKARLLNAVENYGNLFKLMIPDNTTFETLGDKEKTGTSNLFNDYIKYWNTEMAIRVLGQSLTTGSDGKGSYGLGKVHNEVREDLVIADMMLVKRAMNIFVKRLLKMNFAGLTEFPKYSFVQEQDIEFKVKRSEIIKNLYECGYRTKQDSLENEFGVELEPITQSDKATQQAQQQYIDKFINGYINF